MSREDNLTLLAPKPLQPDYPLFVFLPGMDGTGKLLHTQLDSLENFFDLRCLNIPVKDNQNWNSLAQEVIQLITAELATKSVKTVYLCGESFGGCLAMQITTQAPELLTKLILVNPASCFSQQPLLSLGIPITRWLPDSFQQTASTVLLPFLASLHRVASNERRALWEAMSSVPGSIVSWRLSLLRDFQLPTPELSSFSRPVLLIASGADLLLPSLKEARNLEQIFPNANVAILPDSGHACLIEAEVQLEQILHQYQFLPELSPSQSLILS